MVAVVPQTEDEQASASGGVERDVRRDDVLLVPGRMQEWSGVETRLDTVGQDQTGVIPTAAG